MSHVPSERFKLGCTPAVAPRAPSPSPRLKIETMRALLARGDNALADDVLADAGAIDTPNGPLVIVLTRRLRRRARRARQWGSRAMLVTLANSRYGYDPSQARSRGGRDGIFRLDRDFHPANAMQRKLFAGFLDRDDPLLDALERRFLATPDGWTPVRLVSHQLRLLGVLISGTPDWLVLVDLDG